MEDLIDLGLTRFIGVANFNVQLLTDVLSYAVKPCYINQVEMHPYNTQQELLDFCKKNGVRVTAFSPLGSPSYVELGMDQKLNILTEDCIVAAASKHSKTSAQILLRWAVQRGTSIVTKSSKMSRVAENFDIFNFKLSEEEMQDINALNCNVRFNDPGVFCGFMGGAIPIYK